jgi:hypothetical protein
MALGNVAALVFAMMAVESASARHEQIVQHYRLREGQAARNSRELLND